MCKVYLFKLGNIKKFIRFLVFYIDLKYGFLGVNECSIFNLIINCKDCVESVFYKLTSWVTKFEVKRGDIDNNTMTLMRKFNCTVFGN